MPPRRKPAPSGTEKEEHEQENAPAAAPAPLSSAPSSFESLEARAHDALERLSLAAAPAQAEAAWRAKAEAQQRLIEALRADNARLAAKLADTGPVPPLAVRASTPYKALEAEARTHKERSEALAAEIALLRQEPPVPPAAARALALFGALTALRILPRAPSAGAPPVSTTPFGLFDIETEEPETGAAVRFSLEYFAAPLPPPFSPSAAAASAAPIAFPTGVVVEFVPGAGCTDFLPAFLHETITFGSEQGAMFFAKVTEALRRADDTEPAAPAAAPAAAPSQQLTLESGSPTIVLGAEAAASAADAAEAAAETPDAAAVPPLLAFSFGGRTVEIASLTPAALQRQQKGTLATPAAAGAEGVAAATPFTNGRAPAGVRAPAPTPAPPPLPDGGGAPAFSSSSSSAAAEAASAAPVRRSQRVAGSAVMTSRRRSLAHATSPAGFVYSPSSFAAAAAASAAMEV